MIIPPLSPFPGRGAAPEDYIERADTVMQQLPRTVEGIQAVSDALNLGVSVLSLGYLPAVAYGAGIAMKLAIQTVQYGGVTYAPLLGSLPFTTSGTFESDKFRVIQGLTADDLAADTCAARINYQGTMLDVVLGGLPAPVELFGADPSGVLDSSAAFVSAAAAGAQVVCTGSYLLNNLPDSMDWRRFSGSGTAQIKSRLFTFAYIQKPRLSFDEVKAKIAYANYKNSAGTVVNLAIYGDSIVDGVNTTGVTGNPVDGSGKAIGTTDHTAAAPAAFSNQLLARFQEAASAAGLANRINVWNAGYSSKAIATGWANENYERAIIKNPYYGHPDAVGIQFAINDSYAGAASTPIDSAIFSAELGKLIAKIQGYGAAPFMITTPEICSTIGYDARTIRSIYAAVKSGLAASGRALTVLDMGLALEQYYNLNTDANAGSDAPISSGRTSSKIYQLGVAGAPDRTHPHDRAHRFMAGYLFSQFYPNILMSGATGTPFISPTEYRWRFRVIDAGAGTVLDAGHTTQQGGQVYAKPGFYGAGAAWNCAWVWNENPDAWLVYRAGDTNGNIPAGQNFITLSDACVMTVINKTNGNFLYSERVPNDGVAPGSALTADRPFPICQLGYGLNYVALNSPLVNSYNYFPGAIQITPELRAGYGGNLWSDYSAASNLLSECGSIYKTQPSGTISYGVRESKTGANWVSFGRTGKTTSILLEVQIGATSCLGVICGAGQANKRVNGSLYRDNDTRISVVLFMETWEFLYSFDVLATFAYTKTGMQRIRVDLTRSGVNQMITLYDGWGTDTVIGTFTSNNATPKCWPWAGHFGDHYLNGSATLECKSATVTYF